MKKIFFSILIFATVFGGTSFFRMKIADAAAVNYDAKGWPWGGSDDGAGKNTGVGWVSLNSSDPGAGGSSYAVNVPPFDAPVTGYAWSENLGWIDFNPQDHCTTGIADATHYKAASCVVPVGYNVGSGGVKRSGNNLVGWARFVGIAQESANGNSGGFDGWIGLGIGSGFDVGIAADGKMSGNGWSELGAINFLGQAVVPPTVTLNPSSSLINVKTSGLPQTVTLTWSSTNATNCDVASTSGMWSALNIGASGNHPVAVSSGIMNERFTVTCHGPGGDASAVASISTVCYPQVCASQTCGNDTSGAIYGVSNQSTCSPQSTCSADTDCMPKNIIKWREVAPTNN